MRILRPSSIRHVSSIVIVALAAATFGAAPTQACSQLGGPAFDFASFPTDGAVDVPINVTPFDPVETHIAVADAAGNLSIATRIALEIPPPTGCFGCQANGTSLPLAAVGVLLLLLRRRRPASAYALPFLALVGPSLACAGQLAGPCVHEPLSVQLDRTLDDGYTVTVSREGQSAIAVCPSLTDEAPDAVVALVGYDVGVVEIACERDRVTFDPDGDAPLRIGIEGDADDVAVFGEASLTPQFRGGCPSGYDNDVEIALHDVQTGP